MFLASARAWVFNSHFNVERRSGPARRLDTFITWLIVANLLALVFEHIPAVYSVHAEYFHLFDRLSIYFFTLEYVLRLFAAGGDPRFQGRYFPALRFSLTAFALIDILVIAPYWLHLVGVIDLDLRALRALRLLRLLKLMRDFVPALADFRRANKGRTIRQKVDALINETPTSGRLHRQIDWIFMFFIISSVLAVFLETIPAVHDPLHIEFQWFDTVSITIFTLEYLLRLYAAPETMRKSSAFGARLGFIKKPSSVVDLLAILPYYLQFLVVADLRFIRILRALRILKLSRYNTALTTFGQVLKREHRAFFAAMFITALITVISAAVVYELEHGVQPDKFDTMPRALYWAVITLASVGYGDLSPVTPIGQAFTMMLAILGIGIVALPAGILGSAFSDQLQQQREQMLKEVEEAFADGVLSEDESRHLEEERIRLHLTEEQLEGMKERAMARFSAEATLPQRILKASDEIIRLREELHALPIEAAVVEIDKLNLPGAEKAALRVLLR